MNLETRKPGGDAAKVRIGLHVRVTLELDESEVRALDGIFGYSVESFLKVFYEKMGQHYVQPYEAGVRSLHARIRGILSGPLRQIDDAKKRLYGVPDSSLVTGHSSL